MLESHDTNEPLLKSMQSWYAVNHYSTGYYYYFTKWSSRICALPCNWLANTVLYRKMSLCVEEKVERGSTVWLFDKMSFFWSLLPTVSTQVFNVKSKMALSFPRRTRLSLLPFFLPYCLPFINSFHLFSCLTCIHLSLSSLLYLSSTAFLHIFLPIISYPRSSSPCHIFFILPCTPPTPTPIPQTSTPPLQAPGSLIFDEGWWRCMSGGIDNIYRPNENDPSSLAGLSPHWPNFIMANYHGRPLFLCCCWWLAPIYMDTWTH